MGEHMILCEVPTCTEPKRLHSRYCLRHIVPGFLGNARKWLFEQLFKAEMQKMKSELEQHQAAYTDVKKRMSNIEHALKGINVAADAQRRPGNWVVATWTTGKDTVHSRFYDFGNRNVTAFVDFLERYRRAGMTVQGGPPFIPKGDPQ